MKTYSIDWNFPASRNDIHRLCTPNGEVLLRLMTATQNLGWQAIVACRAWMHLKVLFRLALSFQLSWNLNPPSIPMVNTKNRGKVSQMPLVHG